MSKVEEDRFVGLGVVCAVVTETQRARQLFFCGFVILLLEVNHSDFVKDKRVLLVDALRVLERHKGGFEVVCSEVLHADKERGFVASREQPISCTVGSHGLI